MHSLCPKPFVRSVGNYASECPTLSLLQKSSYRASYLRCGTSSGGPRPILKEAGHHDGRAKSSSKLPVCSDPYSNVKHRVESPSIVFSASIFLSSNSLPM